ncbi:unnamed protein product [Orchesella dallaii]|uniref:F-box domain-containing protein n=1 Tax=Orchesella dallaii TaxID=48710 RepID=A0ABP1PIM1_9HEXA
MEGEVASPPPAIRPKLLGGGGFEVEVQVLRGGGGEEEVFDGKYAQNVSVYESPRTEPMLVPELWAQIFGYLPPDDLITVINTCPEWAKLLEAKRTSVLFPKILKHCALGYLGNETVKVCRTLNKACKEAIDLAIPEIPQMIRIREGMEVHLRAIQARIRLWMRRHLRNGLLREQGLPEEGFREGDEEEVERPGQENEFNAEQMRDFILRKFRRPQE